MNALTSTHTADLTWHEADVNGCLAASPVAAAFADDSTVKYPPVAGPVEAALRESGDGSRMVLCLHNPSSAEVRVSLAAVMPEYAGAQWHFVSGAMDTTSGDDGLHIRLAAASRTWLTVTP
ncbi:hypothetical protein AB0N99_36675 [Streptomyces sp. NPDC093272]|uniref:hypothetical protein n=1 Tax=unclassified Streptomyces TaxID=2593676 RepID=UPI003441B51D